MEKLRLEESNDLVVAFLHSCQLCPRRLASTLAWPERSLVCQHGRMAASKLRSGSKLTRK